MSSPVTEVEQRLTEIEREPAFFVPLVHERDRLLRARAALLGEPPPDSPTLGRRIAREEVAVYPRAAGTPLPPSSACVLD
jgi:hypothetical protein